LDFFRVPADSPRRTQEGVYHCETFGPPGKRVQVILLDTRYFRSRLVGGKPYAANNDPAATILGPAQWRWFEEQLRQPADLRLVVSSIQVVSQDHGGEKWMNIPHERRRLYELIRDTKANGVIFLSGDRHFADLSVMDGGVGYPLFDLTSSGLTQAARAWRPLLPNTQRVAGMSFGTNFGLIAIDWAKPDPIASLQIHDEAGDVRINQKLPLSILRPAKAATKPASLAPAR
jgi:alkaline phosphatase D